MEFVAEDGKSPHASCSTLILPALSIGNVGQLAVDLLVSSTDAERIGYLDDPNLLPCVGNDAYRSSPPGNLALPLEVFDSPANGITFIQQRSPVVRGMMVDFARNIANFAASSGKKHVVLLSGLEFGRWRNIDMSGGLQIFYLSSTNPDGSDAHCEQFGWKRLQEYQPTQMVWEYLTTLAEGSGCEEKSPSFEDELEDENYYPSLPFAALFSCFKAKGLQATCLLCYCSEGDNTSDAFHLAEAVSKLEGLNCNNTNGDEGSKWVIPFSWRTVYGPPPDMSMF